MTDKSGKNPSEKSPLSRRSFIETAAVVGGLSVLPLEGVLSASDNKVAVGQTTEYLTSPLQGEVLESTERDLPDGKEVEQVLEYSGANGKKDQVRIFLRRVDAPNSYVVFLHKTSSLQKDSNTIVQQGKKGQVDGNVRNDEIQTTIITQNGMVRRLPAQAVKVRLDRPYESLSPNEKLQQLMKDKGMPTDN
jgi:hypothetical protein